jgi:Zn-dependent protease
MQGGFRLFRFRGVEVSLHWTWFLVAAYSISSRGKAYSSLTWNIAEYLAIFLFVLLHEFGHVFACRSVGGKSDHILLWPLGGVAYVDPPQRAGAQLWSIVAGPLVNVGLLIVFKGAAILFRHYGWNESQPEAFTFLKSLWWINFAMLCFNLLPIYPLDGGQIVRSLLWFILGKGRSLLVATCIGFPGALIVGALAIWAGLYWTAFIAFYLLQGNWRAFQQARALGRLEKLPHNHRFQCPACHSSPLLGPVWQCATCQSTFDLFESGGICPHCQAVNTATTCLECGKSSPIGEWGATI